MARSRFLPFIIGLALLLAACSSSESGATTSSTSGADTSTTSGATTSSTSAATTSEPVGPSGEPIRLGLIDKLSGSLAQIGQDTLQGVTIAVEQINAAGGVLGRPLEIVTEDEVDSAASVDAVRSLNSEGIPFVLGFTSSADALAALPIAEQIDTIIVGSHPATTSLTTTDWVPNFVRISANDAMMANAITRFVYDRFPDVTKWNTFGFDYVTGHDQWESFVSNLTALEPDFERGEEVFFPFDAVGALQPYITSMLSNLPADSPENEGLTLTTFGSGTFNLVQQGAPYELMDQFAVVVAMSGGGFLHQAAQLGADTPEIYSQYDYYYEAYDTPQNAAFVADYEAEYGEVPGSWALQGYMSVFAYAAAFEKAGNTEFADVLAAFDDLTFSAPQGEVTIRAGDHQASVNVVMRHFVPAPGTEAGFEVAEFWVNESADILPPVTH